MKKIYTLFMALATAATAWAAAPELLFGPDKTPVNPTTTYETGYEYEYMDLGVFELHQYKQDSELYIRAVSGKEVSVLVTASAPVQFCGIDGQCLNDVTRSTKTGVFASSSAAGNEVIESLQIDNNVTDYTGVPVSGLLSDITVEVSAWYNESPDQVATAKVVMTNRPASEFNGVQSVVTDGCRVWFGKGNIVEYNNIDRPTKLAIYNTNGSLVLSRTIYQTGHVNLDSLHPGIYIFQAGRQTGKFLIGK